MNNENAQTKQQRGDRMYVTLSNVTRMPDAKEHVLCNSMRMMAKLQNANLWVQDSGEVLTGEGQEDCFWNARNIHFSSSSFSFLLILRTLNMRFP